jgi:hypothetical protein
MSFKILKFSLASKVFSQALYFSIVRQVYAKCIVRQVMNFFQIAKNSDELIPNGSDKLTNLFQ